MSQTDNEFLLDADKDTQLYLNHNQRYMEIRRGRLSRMSSGLKNYMEPDFSVRPMYTLEDLQQLSSYYQGLQNDYPDDQSIGSKIQDIQNKINNNEYCISGSPEDGYRQNFLNHRNTFVWPSTEETLIRDQETQELTSLLNL